MKVEPINPSGLERSGRPLPGHEGRRLDIRLGSKGTGHNGNTVGIGDFEAQADRAFECVAQVLAEAGGDLSDVVKLTAYLVSPLHVERFHDMCARVPHPSPRRHYCRCRLPNLPRRPDRNRSLCPTRAELRTADAADRPIFYGRENRQHNLYLRPNGGKSAGPGTSNRLPLPAPRRLPKP